MEQSLIKEKTNYISRSFVTDIVLLMVIYFIPTISHFVAFPLYMLEPMRVVLFASIILSYSKANSYFLAITIPLFSYFVGGHPEFVKSLIIALELVVNVVVFWLLFKKGLNLFLVSFGSILFAKVIYYVVKAIVLEVGLLKMEFLSTSVLIQLLIAVVISLVMIAVQKLFNNNMGCAPE